MSQQDGAGAQSKKRPDDEEADQESAPKAQNTGKSYKCDFDGCGKAYSRAEHLQRHQLNHAPKEIFHCRVPGCNREFVRQDLYLRHRERHMSHGGSHDSRSPTEQYSDVPAGSRPKRRVGRPSLADLHHGSELSEQAIEPATPSSSAHPTSPPMSGYSATLPNAANSGGDLEGTSSGNWPGSHDPLAHNTSAHFDQYEQRVEATSVPAGYGFVGDPSPTSNVHAFNMSNTSYGGSGQIARSHSYNQYSGHGVLQNVQNQSDSRAVQQFSGQTTAQPSPESFTLSRQQRPSMQHGRTLTMSGINDQPVGDSPNSVRDDFTTWLFDDALNMYGGFGQGQFQASNESIDPHFISAQNAIGQSYDPLLNQNYMNLPQDAWQWNAPAASSPSLSISDGSLSSLRRLELIDIMRNQFTQAMGSNAGPDRELVFQGDLDMDDHALSMRLMQAYIQTYWQHFHEQLPILHRPTFSGDSSPTLLVLAVMAVGASLLPEKNYGTDITDAAQRLANFIAWHIRWQVFMDSSFQPPAKLWVFQTLVLLETYEKMNATRALHERANIHYATTINLMRRGTALIEDTQATQAEQRRLSPHEYWERWITAEATRRVAFAAFFLDAIHANMFGHTAVMVVHEIHLPLPCDEALWSATSPAEVGRIEASFHLNGIKTPTFVQALKKTLTGRKVRTNPFGRMVLMAGLLSVTWHLRQREVQMSTLGVPQANAVPDTWRVTLSKAFDTWKRDFDEDTAYIRTAPFAFGLQASGAHLETRMSADIAIVLHHLSHISMQVTIIDCQILSGAGKLLGRAISQTDRQRVHKKLTSWAQTAGAKVAISHALQLLQHYVPSAFSARDSDAPRHTYKAREDSLLTRPWSLYFAALAIWSYYFALNFQGRRLSPPASPSEVDQSRAVTPTLDVVAPSSKSIQPTPAPVTQEITPIMIEKEQLQAVLRHLSTVFRASRWELCQEASYRLSEALEILVQTET